MMAFPWRLSCTFTDHILELNKDNNSLTEDEFPLICETLVLKMLSNANHSLVSVDIPVSTNLDDAFGLCLRFSSEILSNSMPCINTVTFEETSIPNFGLTKLRTLISDFQTQSPISLIRDLQICDFSNIYW